MFITVDGERGAAEVGYVSTSAPSASAVDKIMQAAVEWNNVTPYGLQSTVFSADVFVLLRLGFSQVMPNK